MPKSGLFNTSHCQSISTDEPGYLTFEYQKIAKKNVTLFLEKFHWQFLGTKWAFLAIFFKCQIFGNFLTFKCQFSGESASQLFLPSASLKWWSNFHNNTNIPQLTKQTCKNTLTFLTNHTHLLNRLTAWTVSPRFSTVST